MIFVDMMTHTNNRLIKSLVLAILCIANCSDVFAQKKKTPLQKRENYEFTFDLPRYDVYSIMNFYEEQIEKRVLYDAFSATCEKRKTIFTKDDIEATLHLISDDLHMEELWEQFKKSNFYVGELEWKSVIDYVEKIMKKNLL